MKETSRPAGRIVLWYAVVAGVWIVVSGIVLGLVAGTPAWSTSLQIIKESAFIAITSLLLYSMIDREWEERSRVERQLRESEERYRTLFETAPVGIGMADEEGNLTAFNRYMLQPGGYTAGEIESLRNVGKLYYDPADRAEVLRLAARQGRLEHHPMRFRRKDGTPYWTLLSLVPITVKGKAGWMAVVVDISEKRQMYEKMRQLDRIEVASRMAAGLVHDFKNLLLAANAYSDFAMHAAGENEAVQADLRRVKEAVAKAAGLCGQLLSLGRLHETDLQLVDLNGLLRNLETVIRHTAGLAVDLVLALDPNPGKVRADPVQMEQVIINLAVNAADAMPDGGILKIATAHGFRVEGGSAGPSGMAPGRYVLLSVSDSGIGMADEVKAHLFEPFFTTKPEGKGTGLGLANVYGIVSQSGGYIQVESQQDRGTIFRVFLPEANIS